MVYRAVVVTTLLYGAEAWVLYRKQVQLLERFHQRCLRFIMNIRWQDYVSNNQVLERANMTSIEAVVMSRQLRWAGHLTRMEDTIMPKAVFYGEMCEGKRDRGAPKKRFKDQLKQQLSAAGIPEDDWQKNAMSRDNWKEMTRVGAETFEQARREKVAAKRMQRKESNASSSTQGFSCMLCSRI